MNPVDIVMRYAKNYDRICVNRIPDCYRREFYRLWGAQAERALLHGSRSFGARFQNGQIVGCMNYPYDEVFYHERYVLVDYQDLMELYAPQKSLSFAFLYRRFCNAILSNHVGVGVSI